MSRTTNGGRPPKEPPLDMVCDNCGLSYKRYKYTIKYNTHFCGMSCRREFQKRQVGKTETHMKCADCKESKPFSEFYAYINEPGRYKSYCKSCALIRASVSNKKRLSKPGYKSHIKNKRLKRQYGISLEDFNLLLERQNEVCAICRSPQYSSATNRSLVVDHCHTTGKVRGLLCSNCNSALGLLRESLEIFNRAATYLKQHKEKSHVS